MQIPTSRKGGEKWGPRCLCGQRVLGRGGRSGVGDCESLGRCSLGDGEPDGYDCARSVGVDFERPAELSQPLTHASDADSGSAGGGHLLLLFEWDAFAFVLDLDQHLMVALPKANLRNRTS